MTTRSDAEKRAEKLPPGYALAGIVGMPNEAHVFKGIPAPIGGGNASDIFGKGGGKNAQTTTNNNNNNNSKKRKLENDSNNNTIPLNPNSKGGGGAAKGAKRLVNSAPKRPPSRAAAGAKVENIQKSKKQKTNNNLQTFKSMPITAGHGFFGDDNDGPDIMSTDLARYHSLNGGMHEVPGGTFGLSEIERQQEYLINQRQLRTLQQIQEEKEQKIALKKKLGEVQALMETLERRAESVANERDEKYVIMQKDQNEYAEKDELRKKHPAYRVIAAQRQKSGAKSEFKEGFEVLRYRSLLDVVHRHCLAAVRQLSLHDWGGPFRMPVDAEALGLANYYTIVTTPMDLGTIKKFIEVGGKYELAKEVHEDVELTFTNAMKFNAEGTDVHIMAKTLLQLWNEKYETIVAREIEVEEGLLIDREACISRATSLASKMEYQTIQSDCATIVQALQLAQNQLDELESKSILLFTPLTADEKSALGDILQNLCEEDAEKARQILSEAPTNEYNSLIQNAESLHRQHRLTNGTDSDWDDRMHVPMSATDITSRRLQRFTRMSARNKVAQMKGWCGNPLPETKKDKVINAFGGEEIASSLLVVLSPEKKTITTSSSAKTRMMMMDIDTNNNEDDDHDSPKSNAEIKKENENNEFENNSDDDDGNALATTGSLGGEKKTSNNNNGRAGFEGSDDDDDDGGETTTGAGIVRDGDDIGGSGGENNNNNKNIQTTTSSKLIQQEKMLSDGATTEEDPLHAFAINLGFDSKACKEARNQREERQRMLEQETKLKASAIAIERAEKNASRAKQQKTTTKKRGGGGGGVRRTTTQVHDNDEQEEEKEEEEPDDDDDEFEQNLRGIDSLGDADDFDIGDFDALLGTF